MTPSRPRTARPPLVLAALAVALELVLVWGHPWFPSNDGPAHQYTAWVAHELKRDPDGPLAEHFRLQERSIYPNAAYARFLEALVGRVDLRAAEKLGISLYLVALPASLLVLCRALGRDGALAALAAAGLAPNFLLFMGFFGFLWGVPCALFYLAAMRGVVRRPSVARLVAANLLLALTFWAHLVAFAAAVAAALIWMATARERRRWLWLVAVAPVALAAPYFWPSTVGADDHWIWSEGPAQQLVALVGLRIATAFGGDESIGAAVVGPLLGALAVGCLLRRSKLEGDRELGVLCVVLAAGVLVSPSAIGAGSFLDKRLHLLAWLALAAAIEPRDRRLRGLAAALIVVAIGAHVAFLDRRFGEFDREMTAFLSGLDHIRPGAAVHCYTDVPPHQEFHARPIATASSYYHLALGTPSYSHYPALPGAASYFPIAYTEAAKERFERPRRRNRISVGHAAGWADYLAVWGGDAPELRPLRARSDFVQIHWVGALRLFRRVARPAVVP